MTSTLQPYDPTDDLRDQLGISARQIRAVISLLAEGATVPFIARYRKEATGNLDEVQIRDIDERRAYLTELDQRKRAVIEAIAEQGKLTEPLERAIRAATTKAAVEDLYAPYKKKRRTRAVIARDRGLEPLAMRILDQPAHGDPLADAAAFTQHDEVADGEAALQGAKDIVAEVLSERHDIRTFVRSFFAKQGALSVEPVKAKTQERTKYEQYYNYVERVSSIPSHRFLAIRRGERDGVLRVGIDVPADEIVAQMLRAADHDPSSPYATLLSEAARDAYQRLLAPTIETDIRVELKLKSDTDAVDIFATNLEHVLLAPPLGAKRVIGVDPGLRTGCKCVEVDETGKFIRHTTLYLVRGDDAQARARDEILRWVRSSPPGAIGVGNGTGGRETEAFLRETLREASMQHIPVVSVSESGASIYSASDVAREEFPDLDLTLRGAISIARRLQDPLSELVKIDPKSIGVGQYQHDVHQPLLHKKLDEVVETCVNRVGVELNTASAPLLSRVAGVGPVLAKKIVAHRDQRGAFTRRADLLDVSGLGPKTFEQAAGFLRVRQSEHPLDRSAVHPERYKLVAQIARDLKVPLATLVGDADLVARIRIQDYLSDDVGEPTLRDILDELTKPGRDPRETFEPPTFRDDVQKPADLREGMTLQGVVTNVTAFGAFVDIGVHQDGLVHISQLADRFVRDPSEVVSAGDKLTVRVLDVDLERNRISLTARSGPISPPSDAAASTTSTGARTEPRGAASRPNKKQTDSRGKARHPAPRRDGAHQPATAPPGSFGHNPFADLRKRKS